MTYPTGQAEQRTHVWIVNGHQSKCAECGDELPVGARILWTPGAPRDKNNHCAPCGIDIAGSYPPNNYWERREVPHPVSSGR